MRNVFKFALLLCFTVAGISACVGETLDRIIAIVNNSPILLSDWDEALRCEALLAGRTPESYTVAEQQAAFSRLVDQELLRQQMRNYLVAPPTPAAELQARLLEVRNQLGVSSDDTKWQALLDQARVSEVEVLDRLKAQLEIERFVDVRFRSGIRIDDRSIARYYRDQFLPDLHKAGGQDVPLDGVADRIREILMQQRIEEQLTAWIQTLREQTEIRIPGSAPAAATASQESNKQ